MQSLDQEITLEIKNEIMKMMSFLNIDHYSFRKDSISGEFYFSTITMNLSNHGVKFPETDKEVENLRFLRELLFKKCMKKAKKDIARDAAERYLSMIDIYK